MTIRPIIFSAPMVRASLESRKTQTRRVLKRAPQTFLIDGKACGVGLLHVEGETVPRVLCGNVLTTQKVPYAIGDLLYVREAFAYDEESAWEPQKRGVFYLADGNEAENDCRSCGIPFVRRPSIHMPRWASRLTLAVTDVRVERLNEISEQDAIAEGCVGKFIPEGNQTRWLSARDAFYNLWNALHGPGAWDKNPWVVAVTFTVHKINVDAFVGSPDARAAQ